MKRIKIVHVAFTLIIAATLASCSTGRVYRPYPPRTSVSLILNAGPGIIVSRYPDGRYYYRAPNGYIYWRGYNNRYYLDSRYIKPYYRHKQYNEWKRYHRRRR